MNRSFFAVFAVLLPVLTLPASAQPADREVVKVNGTPIRQSEVLERLWKRYGNSILEEMVDEMLLRQAVQKAKIAVPPAEVDKRFSKVRAQFSDPKIFETELANAGSSAEKLKIDLKEQISREKLVIAERKLSTSEEEIKKTFDDHRDELGQREAVHLRHILVATKSQADELVAKVKAGGDFAALARQASLAPTGKVSGGDYGFVSKGMLPAEIEEIAFALKDDELKVIPSPKGFHILQSLGRRKAVPAEYAKVKDDLREVILQEKVKSNLPDYMRLLREKADIKPQVN